MRDVKNPEFANLANSLNEAAADLSKGEQELEAIEREKLIKAIVEYRGNKMSLAKTLVDYSAVYKVQKTWTNVAAAVARELDMGKRSLDRLISQYKKQEKLPVAVRKTIAQAGIDPIRPKYEALINQISKRSLANPELSIAEVTELIRDAEIQLKTGVKSRSEFPKLNEQDGLLSQVRSALRAVLERVPEEEIEDYLRRAIEQEMFDVFNRNIPIQLNIAITPQQGASNTDEHSQGVELDASDHENALPTTKAAASVKSGPSSRGETFFGFMTEGQEVA